jgi:hypothetical protein
MREPIPRAFITRRRHRQPDDPGSNATSADRRRACLEAAAAGAAMIVNIPGILESLGAKIASEAQVSGLLGLPQRAAA